MAQPSVPDTEQIARQLQAVDLSGGASTADRGSNSARAIASALTPVGSAGNLLKSYALWKQRQGALDTAGIGQPLDVKKVLGLAPEERRREQAKHARRAAHRLDQARREAALAGPAALEDRALKKGKRTYAKHLPGGQEVATRRAFAKYSKHGGKLGSAAFRRRLG